MFGIQLSTNVHNVPSIPTMTTTMLTHVFPALKDKSQLEKEVAIVEWVNPFSEYFLS